MNFVLCASGLSYRQIKYCFLAFTGFAGFASKAPSICGASADLPWSLLKYFV